MPSPHRFPQQRRSIGHDKPRRLNRVLRTETAPIPHLTGQIDDQRERFLRLTWSSARSADWASAASRRNVTCRRVCSFGDTRRSPAISEPARASPTNSLTSSSTRPGAGGCAALWRSVSAESSSPSMRSRSCADPQVQVPQHLPQPVLVMRGHLGGRTLRRSSAWQACHQMLGPRRQARRQKPSRAGTSRMPEGDGLEHRSRS